MRTLWAMTLGMREDGERLRIACARVADRVRQPADGLDVLGKHLEPAVDHRLDVGQCTLEVRGQGFDGRIRTAALDLADARGEVRGSAVRQVVAIDRSEHDIAQAHEFDGTRGVRGLIRVEPSARIPGVDRTEPARASTDLAHQHQGRGTGVPAFADVGTLRFLADRREAMLADRLPHLVETRARRHGRPQPGGLAGGLRRVAAHGGLDPVLDRDDALGGAVFLPAPRGARHDRDALEFSHFDLDPRPRSAGGNCTVG